MTLPILYSFRRCPYAIRARFALEYADIKYVVREVDLKNKPAQMIAISPKGTVPILFLHDGTVIDQSIEIVQWALKQKAEPSLRTEFELQTHALIQWNDTKFIKAIHRFKYRDNYPREEFETAQTNLFCHLKILDEKLSLNRFLVTNTITKADIAVFPFVRQVVLINPEQFRRASLQGLMQWLDTFLQHPLFDAVMTKFPVWSEE